MDDAEKKKNTRAANIRTLWGALQCPDWDKDSLIDLGKAIFARRSLKDLSDKQFETIFPRLVKIIQDLEEKFTPNLPAETTSPQGIDGPDGPTGPGPCPTSPQGIAGPQGEPPTSPGPRQFPPLLKTQEKPATPTEDPATDMRPSRKE